MDENSVIKTRIASPRSFPLDPRHEQTRTKNIRPAARVFNDKVKRDASRLLSLPDEILWRILDFLAEEYSGRHLSMFALASGQCRQLARPYQFADIWITRSELSWALVRYLIQEAKTEQVIPSIGSYIRSMTITIDHDHKVDLSIPWSEPLAVLDELEVYEEYWAPLFDDLAEAVDSSMPNLESSYWTDTGEFATCDGLLMSLLRRTTSSGRLRNLYFSEYDFFFGEVEEVRSKFPSGPLLIRDLGLGYDYCYRSTPGPYDSMRFFREAILRQSSSTLESLVYSGSLGFHYLEPENKNEPYSLTNLEDGPIVFDRLQKFWAGWSDNDIELDTRVLECILAAPLESFAPSDTICTVMQARGPADCFPLRHLKTFAMTGAGHTVECEQAEYMYKLISLAEHYTGQMEELFIYYFEHGAIDDQRVPKLEALLATNRFDNLRYLCFSWHHDPHLTILKAIGANIPSLEELSFGFQPRDSESGYDTRIEQNNGWEDLSTPVHENFIAAISPLPKLARLCVFGDEYIADWCEHWSRHRFLKEHVWFHQGRSYTKRECGRKPWEGQTWSEAIRGHTRPGDKIEDWLAKWVTGCADTGQDPREAVNALAAQYAEAIPSLREFMSGRVLVEITREGVASNAR
ncbi:uncharacterized protein F5Z01DRAFT_156914 [Emericellopsis atlantica]|uniref:Uncharacterized protein n=1 Tax=Emericellopsis atlantica TaxID=2614577 RepID=A0A9P8CNK3_9HYPO|nr:uncharacterized protein F5Z01DRAFT_156914 [Emericellopsis atlantica]KAG9253212.1 hypothetical protein F5Z01DRAFT_156914 [Emericellopsis atlantica]